MVDSFDAKLNYKEEIVRMISRFQTHNDEKVSKINCLCHQNSLELFSKINEQTK